MAKKKERVKKADACARSMEIASEVYAELHLADSHLPSASTLCMDHKMAGVAASFAFQHARSGKNIFPKYGKEFGALQKGAEEVGKQLKKEPSKKKAKAISKKLGGLVTRADNLREKIKIDCGAKPPWVGRTRG